MQTKRGALPFAVAFLAPVLIIYTVLVILPMFSSLYYGLTKWNGVAAPQFIGLDNFHTLFGSSDYWRTFNNPLKFVLITPVVQVPGGLMIAYMLHHRTRFFKFFRTFYFLPVVIAPVASGLMFSLFYNSEVGIFNKILEALGLGAWKRRWLSDPNVVIYSVIAPQAWQYIGMYITIFLAALQGVPMELSESAEIDGANSFQIFWHMNPCQRRYRSTIWNRHGTYQSYWELSAWAFIAGRRRRWTPSLPNRSKPWHGVSTITTTSAPHSSGLMKN
jgi:raffinose/stachyose/melibiose transport system permease protein